jgi:hypothetical protein
MTRYNQPSTPLPRHPRTRPLDGCAFAARDVLALFGSQAERFADVRALPLLDGAFRRDRLPELRAFLARASAADLAVVYFAGHGVRDAATGNYLFCPADTDFARPSARGVSYADLEALLAACPARNKLLLMDSCHAPA